MVDSTSGTQGGGGGASFPTLLDPLNDRKCKTLDPPATKSLEHKDLFIASGKRKLIIDFDI